MIVFGTFTTLHMHVSAGELESAFEGGVSASF